MEKKLFGIEFRSLRNKMILWAVVFVLPIIVLLFFSTNLVTRSYEEQTQANISQLLIPFARQIDVTLENTRRYVANKTIDLSVLDESSVGELERLAAVRALGDGLSEDLSVYSQVDALFLYHDGGMLFVQNYNRPYARHRRAADALTDYLRARDVSSPLFQQGYSSFESDGEYYLFIAIDLPGGDAFGCWFHADTLLEEIRASNIDGLSMVMFADQTGRMLSEQFSTRSSRLLRELLSGYFVASDQLSSGSFTLTALLDRSVIFAPLISINRAIAFALSLAVVFFFAYIGFLRGSLIRPLNRLISAIETINMGNFHPLPVRDDEDVEIRNIYRALNSMTNEIESLKIRVYEERLTQQQARMQLYQLQLRPHFFLNALNTILSYARANEYALVQRMTLHLAAHCRYILYNAWFVSVEEELTYTQNYIDMQGIQHDTRLRYSVRPVADALLDEEIPILAIQIFVENALKYSRSSTSEIQIDVAVLRTERGGEPYLRLIIEDTGVGFSEELLSRLNAADVPPPSDDDHGIGIENVRQRLLILYDGMADILFYNKPCGGAHVEMNLPMKPRKERGQA